MALDAPLHTAPTGPRDTDQWDNHIRRFRTLREGLTSNGFVPGLSIQVGCRGCWSRPLSRWVVVGCAPHPTPLAADTRATQVYELSADVCAGGGNQAELLICLEQLVMNLYPTAQAGGTPRADPSLSRRDEMHAALLLYFAAVPRRIKHEELVHQLTAARCQLEGRCMQLALAAVRALCSCDYVAYFKAARQAPESAPMLRYMLKLGADKASDGPQGRGGGGGRRSRGAAEGGGVGMLAEPTAGSRVLPMAGTSPNGRHQPNGRHEPNGGPAQWQARAQWRYQWQSHPQSQPRPSVPREPRARQLQLLTCLLPCLHAGPCIGPACGVSSLQSAAGGRAGRLAGLGGRAAGR